MSSQSLSLSLSISSSSSLRFGANCPPSGVSLSDRIYGEVILRRLPIVVLTLLITVAAVLLGSILTPKAYTSSQTLRLATTTVGSNEFVNYDSSYADRLMNTFSKLVEDESTRRELMTKLGISSPPKTAADVVANTELIVVTVDAPTPKLAQDGAKALSDLLIARSQYLAAEIDSNDSARRQNLNATLKTARDELAQARQAYYEQLSSGITDTAHLEVAQQDLTLRQQIYQSALDQVNRAQIAQWMRNNGVLSVVSPAVLPTLPSRPNIPLNTALAVLGGLLAGLGLAFAVERIDTRLRTSAQIERAASAPVLVSIARQAARDARILTAQPLLFPTQSPQFDALRVVAAGLQASAAVDKPPKTVLVTSPRSAEGKSTVAINLALALAETGLRVLIVDANLHKPVVHSTFAVNNESGLSSILSGNQDVAPPIHTFRYGAVSILTSGPTVRSAGELLSTEAMRGLLKELSSKFDAVVIDSPGVLSAADTTIMARFVDRVIVVTQYMKTTVAELRQCVASLQYVRAHIEGVILMSSDRADIPTRDVTPMPVVAASSVTMNSLIRPTRDMQIMPVAPNAPVAQPAPVAPTSARANVNSSAIQSE